MVAFCPHKENSHDAFTHRSFPRSGQLPGRGQDQSRQRYLDPGDSRLQALHSGAEQEPATIQKVIDLAATLDAPFTSKQVMGHLKWLYTDGQLEVDGKSYVVEPKAKAEPKAKPKPAKAEAKKPEAKAVVAARSRSPARPRRPRNFRASRQSQESSVIKHGALFICLLNVVLTIALLLQ